MSKTTTKPKSVQQGKYIKTSVYVPMQDTMQHLADNHYLDDVAFQSSSVPFLGIYKDLRALDEHFYENYYLSDSIMEKIADELTRQLQYNVKRMLDINDDIALDDVWSSHLSNRDLNEMFGNPHSLAQAMDDYRDPDVTLRLEQKRMLSITSIYHIYMALVDVLELIAKVNNGKEYRPYQAGQTKKKGNAPRKDTRDFS